MKQAAIEAAQRVVAEVPLWQYSAEDSTIAEQLDEALATAVTYVLDRFQGEIVNLVSGTIERWDAEETADRLELLLGPDLQFIRINGTVVGAAAGLLLHAIAQALG